MRTRLHKFVVGIEPASVSLIHGIQTVMIYVLRWCVVNISEMMMVIECSLSPRGELFGGVLSCTCGPSHPSELRGWREYHILMLIQVRALITESP